MIKLSDHDIQEIMDLLKFWTEYTTKAGFRGKLKDEGVRINLESSLRQAASGWKENVCLHCAGTGYPSSDRDIKQLIKVQLNFSDNMYIKRDTEGDHIGKEAWHGYSQALKWVLATTGLPELPKQ